MKQNKGVRTPTFNILKINVEMHIYIMDLQVLHISMQTLHDYSVLKQY